MKLQELDLPFWSDDETEGAALEEIEAFEKRVGERLPEQLRQALLESNGGVSNYSSFQRGSFYVPVPAIFGVEELNQAEDMRSDFDTPAGIIAIASGGHEWLGLDYRQGSPPRVVFQESEQFAVEEVAESFEAFLEGLTEH
jgi:hypothetical protein